MLEVVLALFRSAGVAFDRYIMLNSGIFDLVDANDQWLADRGFLIRSELVERDAEIDLPLEHKAMIKW